jgi:hypothetical protein
MIAPRVPRLFVIRALLAGVAALPFGLVSASCIVSAVVVATLVEMGVGRRPRLRRYPTVIAALVATSAFGALVATYLNGVYFVAAEGGAIGSGLAALWRLPSALAVEVQSELGNELGITELSRCCMALSCTSVGLALAALARFQPSGRLRRSLRNAVRRMWRPSASLLTLSVVLNGSVLWQQSRERISFGFQLLYAVAVISVCTVTLAVAFNLLYLVAAWGEGLFLARTHTSIGS